MFSAAAVAQPTMRQFPVDPVVAASWVVTPMKAMAEVVLVLVGLFSTMAALSLF